MPDPKKQSVTLTNTADGPRSFWTADRENRILRKGESWTGDILAADLKDLSSDLAQGEKAKAEAQASGGEGGNGGGPSAEAAQAIQTAAEGLAASNDLAALQKIAKDEKVKVADDADAPTIAIAIATARAGAAS